MHICSEVILSIGYSGCTAHHNLFERERELICKIIWDLNPDRPSEDYDQMLLPINWYWPWSRSSTQATHCGALCREASTKPFFLYWWV